MSSLVVLEQGLRICSSNKFPGDAGTAGLVLGSHIENHGCSGKSTGSGGHTDMNSSPDPSRPSCRTLGKFFKL